MARAKLNLAFALIFILCLLSVSQNQKSIHIQKVLATDESNTAYLLNLARNAWEYFQPGAGVNEATGLHNAEFGFRYFTDWDLGTYVQAIIDAKKLGLISDDGDWGAVERFNKILTFLENRPRAADGQTYVWYSSESGMNNGDYLVGVIDAGRLLVSLKNLRFFKPDLAARIDNVVYNLTNYTLLADDLRARYKWADIYSYYAAKGFEGFWPESFSSVTSSMLDSFATVPAVSTYGVTLPSSGLTCDPLLLSFFELQPDMRLQNLTNLVYSAHEARYAATGKFVAFSEGLTGRLTPPYYIYEMVVLPDGQTWVQQDPSGEFVRIPEIIYLKVAVGFLAIYNTTFARNMVKSVIGELASPYHSSLHGYVDGIDENGRVCGSPSDKTNSLIISAVRYAVESSQENPVETPNHSQVHTNSSAPASPTVPLPNATSTPSLYPSTSPVPPTESGRAPTTALHLELFYGAAATAIASTIALTLLFKKHKKAGSKT